MTRLLVLLSLLTASAGLATPPDSFDMVVVAQLPYFTYEVYALGDADRDGQPEVYLHPHGGSLYALEHVGDFHFEPTQVGTTSTTPWVLADVDSDGRADLIFSGQRFPTKVLGVIEASDSASLPSRELMIDEAHVAHALKCAVYDLDGDSFPEVAADYDGEGVRLYEAAGDDSFRLVAGLPRQSQSNYCSVSRTSGDLDGDGRPETALGNCVSEVVVFENVASDSCVLTAVLALPHSSPAFVSDVRITPDLDGDSLPEVVTLSADYDGVGLLTMFESAGDDSFVVTWQTQFAGSEWGDYQTSFGDVDGDSVPELAVSTDDLRLYRAVGNDSFEVAWRMEYDHQAVALWDFDGDGRCELVHAGDAETVIRQYTPIAIAERPESKRAEPRRPTILRGRLRLQPSADSSQLTATLHDPAGRVVMRLHPGDNDIRHLSSGVYFIRQPTADRQPLTASRRVVVAP